MGGLPSARGHFGQRSLAEDPIYRGTTSQWGEGDIRGGDGGGRVAPHSTPPSPEDIDLEEATIPHLFTTRSVV
jgi:hypothetical protein